MAWTLLPAGIVIIAVVTLVLSNYQKEAGLAAPGTGGRAAVAAVARARDAASGSGATAYDTFSKALAVAVVETNNMAVTNAAEVRLHIALSNAVDCLSAAREAWQADLEQYWDPSVDGSLDYWLTLHPALSDKNTGPLAEAQPVGTIGPEQVRRWAESGIDYWLQKAVDLAK